MAIPTPVSFWNFDESSGNPADAVGSNTLTNNNSATFTTGLIGNAADLERGSSQSFSITDASQTGLDITGDLSLSSWIKFESSLAANGTMTWIDKFLTTNQRAYTIGIETFGGNFIDFSISSDGTGANTTTAQWSWSPSTATWYHVVVSYDASAGSATLYINGSQFGSTITGLKTSIFNGTSPFTLGYDGFQYFDGLLDMVGVWNVALTSSEVTELYNSGAGVQYPFASATNHSKLLLLGVG